jgi:polar amino acid transport system permease protein
VEDPGHRPATGEVLIGAAASPETMSPMFAVSFDTHLFLQRVFSPDHVFVRAMLTTLYIAVSAQIIGVIIGLFAALARQSASRPLRALAFVYALAIRGTPVLVQIFFLYYGANLFFGVDLFPRTADFGVFSLSGAVLAGIAALAINEGAYMGEIIRAGIQSLPPGQVEAAKSLGMSPVLTMRRVVLPQAARVIVPPLGNQFNGMLKTTSLLFFIGVYEMFADAQVHYSSTFKPAEYFGAVAVWYLALTSLWSIIQYFIERRLAVSVRTPTAGRLSWRGRAMPSTVVPDQDAR